MKRHAAAALIFCALFVKSAHAATATGPSCLPQRRGDLAKLVQAQPLLPRSGGGKMVTVTRGSPRWMAAFNAVLAWENDDCAAFAAFAEQLGYQALEVFDTTSASRHYLLIEPDSATPGPSSHAPRKNGLFVLRAPGERARARRLIITAPSLDEKTPPGDDRPVRLYQKLGATVLLLNGAHPCNLDSCSGCATPPGYACGGCARASDAANSVDQLLFALFAALEGTRTHDGARPWLHFEYDGELHGRGTGAPRPPESCGAVAALSQGEVHSSETAGDDEQSYPGRLLRGLRRRLGERCVCDPQRDRGCRLPAADSVLGRLVNQESRTPFDPCTQEATHLSGRFVHFAGHGVPLDVLAAAIAEAIPL
jgi:hypothetical protein